MDKAYHNTEKKVMSVNEYKSYLRLNYRWNSIHSIRCPECGDPIHYVEGNIMVSHFRHDPSTEGHNYCSLYAQGTESNTPESKLRKRLFEEADISLNYEIQYKNGKYSSYLTIPPFNTDDLNRHTKNETSMTIDAGMYRNKIVLCINNEIFNSGEIKRLQLNGFPSNSYIRVNGKDCHHVISYTYECFNPNKQIYSYGIKQNYANDISISNIDLSGISLVLFKKTIGKIYTGRHYVIFASSISSELSRLTSDEAIIKRIMLKQDVNFRYQAYDVCFEKVTDRAIEFCARRECELVQRDDVVVLWPPLISIGEYKYYTIGDELFLSAESDNKSYDIRSFKIGNYVYKSISVANLNAQKFYITKGNKNDLNHNLERALYEENEIAIAELMNSTYLFSNDVLIKRITDEIKLKKLDHLIQYKDRLNIVKISNANTESIDNTKVMDVIRYGNDYIEFNDEYYKLLREENANSDLIVEYLDMCKSYGSIKREVLELLMEE